MTKQRAEAFCHIAFRVSLWGLSALVLALFATTCGLQQMELSGAFIPTHRDYSSYRGMVLLQTLVGLPIVPLVLVAVASVVARTVLRRSIAEDDYRNRTG